MLVRSISSSMHLPTFEQKLRSAAGHTLDKSSE
jgi:hypothetical protein